MHITTEQVIAVATVLNLVATALLHVFRLKKPAQEVQSIADAVKANAPEIAQAATEVTQVASGLVKEVKMN